MQCRPSDDEEGGEDVIGGGGFGFGGFVRLARDWKRENAAVWAGAPAAPAVKDGVRGLRRKGRTPNLRSVFRFNSSVGFFFSLSRFFLARNIFDLFSCPIWPAIKGLAQSKEFCCNLKICISFGQPPPLLCVRQ